MTIDPARTAVLIMDYQQDVVTTFVPTPADTLERAATLKKRVSAFAGSDLIAAVR